MSTPTFFQALQEGDLQVVEQLIDQDPALVNAKNESDITAVLVAIYYGKPVIADLLIRRGAHLGVFEAAAAGKLDRVETLLDEDPSLVNAYANDGFQPLGLACFFGHEQIVDFLLGRGAAVNSASKNGQKVMPLHSAVAGQHLDIARMLLDHGADVNTRQAHDYTPLHGAAQNGQLEMVELLLSYNADWRTQSAGGETPLSLAEAQGHESVASRMLSL